MIPDPTDDIRSIKRKLSDACNNDIRRIVEETRTLQLGRFIEPTMRRIIGGEDRSKAQIAASWQLLNAVISPVAPPKTPAIASRG